MVAPLGPCGGNKLGVGHFREKGVFLSSVFKCFVKFHPNIVGNLIMGRDGFLSNGAHGRLEAQRAPRDKLKKNSNIFSARSRSRTVKLCCM